MYELITRFVTSVTKISKSPKSPNINLLTLMPFALLSTMSETYKLGERLLQVTSTESVKLRIRVMYNDRLTKLKT